jgi:hypothetical protein
MKVQISILGSPACGIGNKLFQYALARGYANRIGATLETPPWIGQKIFRRINDPLPSCVLPKLGRDVIPDPPVGDIDFDGHFQFHRAYSFYRLSEVRNWFQFKPEWENVISGFPVHQLVCHMRQGDYLTTYGHAFCLIQEEAYVQAMTDYGYDPATATWVKQDESPKCSEPGLEWLMDFCRTMTAKVLFRSNSTFAWWAATLGNADKVYSPVIEGLLGKQTKVPFVLGNHPRWMMRPHITDCRLSP